MPDDDLDWLNKPPLSPSEQLRYHSASVPAASHILHPQKYDAATHYERVHALHLAYLYRTYEACEAHALALTKRIIDRNGHWPNLDLAAKIGETIIALLRSAGIYEPTLLSRHAFPSPDFETLVLRPHLLEAETFYANAPRVIPAAEALLERFFIAFLRNLPELPEAGGFMVPVIALLPQPHRLLSAIPAFLHDDLVDPPIFARMQRKYFENVVKVSELSFEQAARAPQRMRYPDHLADRSPAELVPLYYAGTPFEDLLLMSVPFPIPQETRFEHHWIVAGTGHGKTQTLQHLIADDLALVEKGAASVVVIDSQGDLIRNVSRLRFFADHPEKLCLIDPTDIEYPVALNLFDMGTARLGTYSALECEKLRNDAIELYEYILAALLGAEMTSKQSTLFRYVLRVMLNIEGATIHTFRELMDGSDKYQDAIERLSPTARAFMESEFGSREHEQTRRQVVRRLWAILENESFERMFSHRRNKLDMFAEMNAGKVILINTAKDLLKHEGSAIFGRFFIALIAQATNERSAAQSARLPCFVYVDECADYLDQNVGLILAQARKFNVGMILAHQYIGQLPSRLPEAFDANTSIKFAGGVSSADARAFARMLRCEPSFIEEQPKGHFAAFVRNLTNRAVSLRVPFGTLESMPQTTDGEWQSVRASIRDRYAARPDLPPPAATSRDTPRQDEAGDDWRS